MQRMKSGLYSDIPRMRSPAFAQASAPRWVAVIAATASGLIGSPGGGTNSTGSGVGLARTGDGVDAKRSRAARERRPTRHSSGDGVSIGCADAAIGQASRMTNRMTGMHRRIDDGIERFSHQRPLQIMSPVAGRDVARASRDPNRTATNLLTDAVRCDPDLWDDARRPQPSIATARGFEVVTR